MPDQDARRGATPQQALASRRILVVDDQPSVREVLEIALTDAGAETRSAADGTEALRVLESVSIDVILLDLVMPGMGGWEFLARLHASAGTRNIPVILQTSAEDYSSFEDARKMGVAAFISKPFRLNEVIETCRRILEGARPLQGRSRDKPEMPTVEVRDRTGEVIGMGTLVDLDSEGAQVELDTPLVLGQQVTVVTSHEDEGTKTRSAEVRWISSVGSRFQHGLLLILK